jgi:uncharacterized membrane protein
VSEPIKVTVIPQEPPITINLNPAPVIKVTLYPVTVAHPSILEAANQAQSSADNAGASADAAAQAAQAAQDAVAGIGDTVDDAVSAAIEAERPNSIINALIFG